MDRVRNLPPVRSWADESQQLPTRPRVLIGKENNGLLRAGHKMVITGPSKAGKSWLALELACALATGGEWLGYGCKPGRVIYVNLELDPSSRPHRLNTVWSSLYGEQEEGRDNLLSVDLRGEHWALGELCPALANRIAELAGNGGENPQGYISAIIIDPFYKAFDGDENSAGDVEDAMSEMDGLAAVTGAAVVFVHHHAKGTAGARKSIDRGSGSGVFARDPDAILDVSPINIDESGLELIGANHPDLTDPKPWRVSLTLREFRDPGPIDVLWAFPVHVLASEEDGLSGCDVEGSNPLAEKSRAYSSKGWHLKNEAIGNALARCGTEKVTATAKKVYDRMDWTGLQCVGLEAFKRWLKNPRCEFESRETVPGSWVVTPRADSD